MPKEIEPILRQIEEIKPCGYQLSLTKSTSDLTVGGVLLKYKPPDWEGPFTLFTKAIKDSEPKKLKWETDILSYSEIEPLLNEMYESDFFKVQKDDLKLSGIKILVYANYRLEEDNREDFDALFTFSINTETKEVVHKKIECGRGSPQDTLCVVYSPDLHVELPQLKNISFFPSICLFDNELKETELDKKINYLDLSDEKEIPKNGREFSRFINDINENCLREINYASSRYEPTLSEKKTIVSDIKRGVLSEESWRIIAKALPTIPKCPNYDSCFFVRYGRESPV